MEPPSRGGAKGIPALGFVFDNTSVANEMAALDAAGMQAYVDAANAQLEADLGK